jgi:hypothetical protein
MSENTTGTIPEINPHDETTATHETSHAEQPTHATAEHTPEPEPVKMEKTAVVHDGYCIICGEDLQQKGNVRPGVMFHAMTHVVKYAGRQGVRICKTCLESGVIALASAPDVAPTHT